MISKRENIAKSRNVTPSKNNENFISEYRDLE